MLPASTQRLVELDDGRQQIGIGAGQAVFGGEAGAVGVEHFLEVGRAGLVQLSIIHI